MNLFELRLGQLPDLFFHWLHQVREGLFTTHVPSWLRMPQLPLNQPCGFAGKRSMPDTNRSRSQADTFIQGQVQKYNTIIGALADGMLITNAAGVITEANPAACRLLRTTSEQLMGRRFQELFSHADAWALEVGTYPTHKPVRLESVVRPGQPEAVPVEVTCVWLDSTEERSRAILLKDISDRRKVETINRINREVENAINYFATSLFGHNTVDDILWDVAKNCIAHLGFVDCVIYLLDESGKNLVQRAAYGPKNPVDFQILAPLVIPVGSGIAGSVAATGLAEIVYDTTRDPRYIVDDAARCSEITVPIIYQDKVIGIIDSEHPEPGFFQPKHLNILTTIAGLCANKIVKVQAEAEARKTQLELAEYHQKLAEFKLMALRSQMNPHFVFNSLSSIQHLITQNERKSALEYLSTFSRLLRQILESSLNGHMLLSEEIDLLKNYLEMEKLRFNHKFSYSIVVDPDLAINDIEIPALLIQPYVENALVHGLLNKKGEGKLRIQLLHDRAYVQCIIEDNGIGRAAAAEIKRRKMTGHKSVGMHLSQERLELINARQDDQVRVEIADLIEGQEATGTRVTLRIPNDEWGRI